MGALVTIGEGGAENGYLFVQDNEHVRGQIFLKSHILYFSIEIC